MKNGHFLTFLVGFGAYQPSKISKIEKFENFKKILNILKNFLKIYKNLYIDKIFSIQISVSIDLMILKHF